MSLRSLLRHNFFTVEMLTGDASEETHGSFEGGWVQLKDFTNINGRLQEDRKNTVTTRFGTVEEEHSHRLYHNNQKLYEYKPDDETKQTILRVITHRNPRLQLSFPVEDKNSVRIYDFMGHIEQDQGIRNKARFFILKLNQVDHLSLT